MFSDHLRKIDEAPHRTLLFVAAALVMVCQLVAMALVAGEQVQKAQMRVDSQVSRQVAVASCVETSRGVAIKDCLRLGGDNFETLGYADLAKHAVQDDVAPESGAREATLSSATSAGVLSGFVSASFAAH